VDFDGNLLYLKIGNVFEPFPNNFINRSTYNQTPRGRLENAAERKSNADLWRVTAPKFKTRLTFQTVPLSLSEMKTVRQMFNDSFTITAQRKLTIRYFDFEIMDYLTAEVYMPDSEYSVYDMDSDSKDILFNPVTFEFVQY
jgi:hypothetical protein